MEATDQFQSLCDILQGSASIPSSDFTFADACHERLHQALLSIGKARGAQPIDLAVLIRHVLRRESELQNGARQPLKVPRSSAFPDEQLWSRAGVRVLAEETNGFLIETLPWRPAWLALNEGESPESDAFKEARRRTYDPVPGDPLLSIVGLQNYSSPGQREAIRGVLNAPHGSTLVINLPTGSGKSLCVQMPALAASVEYGVSVVVVPTTALAIDQERAMRGFIDHPTAYYGDSSSEGQKRRQEIRKRIRDGSQRIVFTSPESVLESLVPSIYLAAERGFLRFFAIDEAHIVDQWGDGFRPSFQELPGLRLDLLRVSPEPKFKTLLMTGTLTESTLDTLESLFTQPGPFEVLSAMQLRPEPSYWFAECDTEETRRSRILEALCHLPRPLILYTTLVEDALTWGRIIKQLGARRLEIMTGKSSSRERIDVIDRWRRKEIDVVVATSAFGLGVDQADVRAVVHACVPETIDRFYQEVGRGGRDGAAALSLVIYTDEDKRLGQRLNKKVSIGADRGRQRWERMFNTKQLVADDRWSVQVDISPGVANVRDINMQSEQNQKWNIRTLTLLACAGIIKFDARRPPVGPSSRDEDGTSLLDQRDDEVTYEQSAEHHSRRVIRILNENHLQESTWAGEIEAIRKKRKKLGRASFQAMMEALDGKVCIAQILSRAYMIPAGPSGKVRKEVAVSVACGGCQYCRKNHLKPYAEPSPIPRPAWQGQTFPIGKPLKSLLGADKLLLIFYDLGQRNYEWQARLEDLVNWFVKQGVRNIVDPSGFIRGPSTQGNGAELISFFFPTFEPVKMPPIPTILIHPSHTSMPTRHLLVDNKSPERIILVPNDTPDPTARHRLLRSAFNGKSFSFDEICSILAL